jgi:hypothetical protein
MRTDGFLEQYPPESHSWAGKVNFGFSYPTHGWIQCTITCTTYLQGIILHLSNVFNPFPGMFHWLEAIAENNLPSEFVVDEEGQEKILRATPVDEEDFRFEILEWPFGPLIKENRHTYLYAQVNKKQFLSEFLKRWDDFLENQYDPSQWEEHGETSLRTYDVSKIREFMKK